MPVDPYLIEYCQAYSSNCTPDANEYLKKQLKLLGEELIRRSERIDFTGFGPLTEVKIESTISTSSCRPFGDEPPSVTISVQSLNSRSCEDKFNFYEKE